MKNENQAVAMRFTSQLPAEHLSPVQELLFFNENQGSHRSAVIRSIERFGEPRLKADGGILRIQTSLLGDVQALFAVHQDTAGYERPIGVAVYTRTDPETMVLLHVVVHPDFAAAGRFAEEMVTVKLIRQVTSSASRIRGIRRIEMVYGVGQQTVIPVATRARDAAP